MLKLFLLIAFALQASSSLQPAGAPFKAPVIIAPGFSAHVLFSNLTSPRGIAIDSHENILVVERGFGITSFSKRSTGWERTVVIQNPNFTQGIQVHGHDLYASTASQALLFSYDPLTKSVTGTGQPVVDGLPPDGGASFSTHLYEHQYLTTHTLQLEGSPPISILIASGPQTNIDPTARDPASGRSQVRRFALHRNTSTPRSWLSGELIAFGIRNPAGIAFSPSSPDKFAYIVENGASIDNVTGLTVTFVNDNPADELETVNLKIGLGKFFGFPDCSTIWNGTADPVGNPQYVGFVRGQQFSLKLEDERDDAWCQSAKNNNPPSLSFQAHSVPLDIKFYNAIDKSHAFPRNFHHDAFVSFHGSFNRNPPTGYGVVHIPFQNNTPASQSYSFLIQAADLATCPGSCIRPVGLVFGNDGRLYATSDSSGELFVIESL